MTKIALFGLGTVGSGVYQELLSDLRNSHSISRIVVKDPSRLRKLEGYERYLSSSEEVFSDPEISMIFEMTNDEDEAFRIVKSSLESGKVVISASKKMLAKNLKILSEIAIKNGSNLFYEAAVCASIPIIALLQTYYEGNKITGIRTIANGTANFILDRLFNEGSSYRQALAAAQNRGFAELDPSDDVEGHDTTSKLALMAANAFGLIPDPCSIPTFGIDHINKQTVEYFKSKSLKIKLIASAELSEDKLVLCTIPTIIDHKDPFYTVEEEQNVVQVTNLLSDKQHYIAKGAGSLPTTQAMLADMHRALSNRKNSVLSNNLNIVSSKVNYYFIQGRPDFLNNDIEMLVKRKSFCLVKASLLEMNKFHLRKPDVFIAMLNSDSMLETII